MYQAHLILGNCHQHFVLEIYVQQFVQPILGRCVESLGAAYKTSRKALSQNRDLTYKYLFIYIYINMSLEFGATIKINGWLPFG